MPIQYHSCIMAAAAICATAAAPNTAVAQAARQSIDLPRQPLSRSLQQLSAQFQVTVIGDAATVSGHQAPAVRGEFDLETALIALLANTDLTYVRSGGSFVMQRADAAASGSEIVVTGTNIRGAPVSSSVITLDRQDIANSGAATLEDFLRSIPQNFAGGQNPAIGTNVPAASGVNVGGGSSLNLRGLGSDATLTLVDGNRLAYSSSRQSVDISAIPSDAIERIEIVADGASAIYGSDAVAGVANIRLVQRFAGISARARIARTGDGGLAQQQAGLIAGTDWGDGGAYIAYQFSDSDALVGAQRDVSRERPGVTLVPELRQHGAFARANHRVGPVNLSVDLMGGHRTTLRAGPNSPAGDLNVSKAVSSATAQSLAIAPSVEADLANGWQIRSTASLGWDEVRFLGETFAGTIRTSSAGGCYCNQAFALETRADGSLFSLASGPAKAAIGAGYRVNAFELDRGAGDLQNAQNTQRSYFAYGEVNIPIVSDAMGISWLHRAQATMAARYEHYRQFGGVATPKLGLLVSPTPAFDLKASWGRSFRTPTFLQQYQVDSVTLLRPASLGGTGFSPQATILFASGGSPDLAPERATSLTASATYRPPIAPGLEITLGYFSVAYRDRIVAPITFIARALNDPIYAAYVDRAPTPAQAAALVAGAGLFANGAGVAFDPTMVAAIIFNNNINAGRQTAQGADVTLSYRSALASGHQLIASANLAYLDSEQRLTPAQPEQRLAGQIFNPPHLRARGSLAWAGTDTTLAATLTHIGGVEDRRFATAERIGAVTSVDLTARFRIGGVAEDAPGFEFAIGLLNAFDAMPDRIASPGFADTPYDSANYSAVGRSFSIEGRRRF